MTICNMSIEWGAKAGMIAPDETTFAYLKGREHAPKGADWDAAVAYWRTLPTDEGAEYDTEVILDASRDHARSSPGAPTRARARRWTAWCRTRRSSPRRPSATPPAGRWSTWTSTPGTPLRDVAGRRGLRRLVHQRPAGGPAGRRRRAARPPGRRRRTDAGRARARPRSARRPRPRAWTRSSPTAGAEWRFAGCSMCLGMNPDTLSPGQRAASTSNRNFEGRQGRGGRTHLVSPQVAAATAVVGRLAAPADL